MRAVQRFKRSKVQRNTPEQFKPFQLFHRSASLQSFQWFAKPENSGATALLPIFEAKKPAGNQTQIAILGVSR